MGTVRAGTLLSALVWRHFREWDLELAERGALLGVVRMENVWDNASVVEMKVDIKLI
jgi:hypothetical protein